MKKFELGDKVVLSDRAAKFLKTQVRNQPRTITEMWYDPERKCNFYRLGTTNRGTNDVQAYAFRSFQLKFYVPGKVGRPRIHQRRARR